MATPVAASEMSQLTLALDGLSSLSPSIQDYLKAIFKLGQGSGLVSTVQLASNLGVAPASVTNMLQKLAGEEPRLLDYQKGHGARLTPTGQQAALRIVRRHRLLETFLSQVLGYSWDEVHAEAERLEHVISPLFEDRISALLGEPEFDPHGDPIPNRQLQLSREQGIISLARLPSGSIGIIRQVDSQDQQLLVYFDMLGIQPGKEVRVLQVNPLDDTLRVVIQGTDNEQVFGRRIAQAIFVTTEK